MNSHNKIVCAGLCLGLGMILCDHYVLAFTEDKEQKKEIQEALQNPEYKKLSEKNKEAKQIFNDLQVFAVLSNELTKFFPEKKEIRGVTVNVRDIMQSLVGVMYNISELGLNIIELIEVQSEPLNQATFCLRYTDEELKAAKEGKYVDNDIRKCLPVGCGSKKACVASSIKKISLAIKTIFDPAVVKYDPATETSQRGLIMNIDLVINQIGKILLETQVVQDGLNKATPDGAKKAKDFVANIDKFRAVLIATGQVFSGILEALIIAAGQLAPESITREELQKHKEVFEAANKEVKVDEKALDDLLLELESK